MTDDTLKFISPSWEPPGRTVPIAKRVDDPFRDWVPPLDDLVASVRDSVSSVLYGFDTDEEGEGKCGDTPITFFDLIPDPDCPGGDAWWDAWCKENGDCIAFYIDNYRSYTDQSCDTLRREIWDLWSACESPAISNVGHTVHIPENHGTDRWDFFTELFTPPGWQIDPYIHTDFIEVLGIDGFTEIRSMDLQAIAAAACATVISNFDIVQWIACLLGPGFQDCIEDYWLDQSTGNPKNIRIEFLPDCIALPGDPGAYTLERGNDCTIHVCVNNNISWFHDFLSGEIPEECFIIQFAAFMLHESLHCCGSEVGLRDRAGLFDLGLCSRARAIQTAFRWAMGIRFPNASGCNIFSSGFLSMTE